MKLTNLFENTIDHRQIKDWLERVYIENYTINEDGTVDVDGDVNISYAGWPTIPVQFGHVSGNFHCNLNNLTTLQGGPTEVGGTYDCSLNKLTSLQGCPREVQGYFNCSWNELTDLQHAPREVGFIFDCSYNKLTSLRGSIREVGEDFRCWNNLWQGIQPDHSFINIGGHFGWK